MLFARVLEDIDREVVCQSVAWDPYMESIETWIANLDSLQVTSNFQLEKERKEEICPSQASYVHWVVVRTAHM